MGAFGFLNNLKKNLDSTGIVLVLLNLAAILFVLYANPKPGLVMWGYWLEGILIGVFVLFDLSFYVLRNYKKIKGLAVFFIEGLFFILHYGFFHSVLFITLLVVSPFLVSYKGFSPIDIENLVVLGGLFFFVHLYSFIYHAAMEKSKIKDKQFWKIEHAYMRILPTCFIIVLLIGVVNFAPSELKINIVCLLMLLKTFLGLAAHQMKYNN